LQPPDLLSGEKGETAVKTVLAGNACHLSDMAFEDAERPPADLHPLINLVGDAEVANGALDLTPLRKGIGLSGAAWFYRPLSVIEGFETEFTFVIKAPPDEVLWEEEGQDERKVIEESRQHGREYGKREFDPDSGRWFRRARASDGFAFVLQLDKTCRIEEGPKANQSRALGSSGLQLGYGGLTSCFAVQFATQPSCKRYTIKKNKNSDGEGDGTKFLCSLMYEPKLYASGKIDKDNSRSSHFYVNAEYAGKECICPTSGKIFVAPELPPERKPELEKVELSHHCDRVSVQCPGVHPKHANTSGPAACMATAKVPELDDGRQHTARILLERNRFHAAGVARTDEEKAALEATGALTEGNPTHRLLVYVDDMQHALINLELDISDVFGETLAETGGRMFAGFTAGTGRANGSHIIKSWRFFEVTGGVRQEREDNDFFGIGRMLGLTTD
jgi:hypothetical protein